MTEEQTPPAESTPEFALDVPSEPVAEEAPEPEVVPVEESVPVAEPVAEMPAELSPPEPDVVTEEVPPPSPPPSVPAPQPETKTAPPAPVPPLPAPKTSSRPRMLEVVRARKAERLEKIVALAREKRVITNDDVQLLLGVSDTTVTNYLNSLVLSGRLRRSGRGRGAEYQPV